MDDRISRARRFRTAGALALCIAAALGSGSAAAAIPEDLTTLSLEELGDIRITSVSKRPERLADAAASIFVIDAEDIRRSGARTFPEVLRLAPNLHVARSSASGYAISARGLNGNTGSAPNKLLVLIDGRSVYTPLFSGVFWDVQDPMLEDIERIEVISGPGGTLWGVNAVNGVINVITKPAGDTQGSLLSGAIGDMSWDAGLRHGGTMGADGHYRVHARHLERRHTETADGTRVDDATHLTQVGFRADWTAGDSDFALHGIVYDGGAGQPAPGAVAISGVDIRLGDLRMSGANLTGKWERPTAGGGRLDLQAYYDRTERDVPPFFEEALDIVDVEFQHTLRPLGAHSVAWGINLRRSRDRVQNNHPIFAFLPAHVTQDWTSVYLQDEVALADDLRMVVGTRLERNDYTGTEVLPNLRLAWHVAPDHLLWSAASRAVRAPSRLDRDVFVPATPPFLLNGGEGVVSEIADVFEVGYRGQPTPALSLSVTAFHNEYDDLRTQEIAPSGTFLVFGSGLDGRATGIEAWGTWQATDAWRLQGGFTALDQSFRLEPGSNDVAAPRSRDGWDPSRTWQLRSRWNFGTGGELDLALRHVGSMPAQAMDAYTALDARIGWRLGDGGQLSLNGRDLLGRHEEYGMPGLRSAFGPSVSVAVTWPL